MRHNPSKEPKFHQVEIFLGTGRSINELLIILINGLFRRNCLFINLKLKN